MPLSVSSGALLVSCCFLRICVWVQAIRKDDLYPRTNRKETNMFDRILSALTAVFETMDDFGRQHWGFILCFVATWWLLDRIIKGVRTNVRWIIQRRKRHQTPVSTMRMAPRSAPDLAQALGRIAVSAVITPPPAASSQAGLASFGAKFGDFGSQDFDTRAGHLRPVRPSFEDEETLNN